MAYSNIAIKYTDEVYATKGDLSKALHTSLISDFWAEVDHYRADHGKKILLKSMDNRPFYFVETPALLARVGSFIDLLNDYQEAYDALEDMPRTLESVDKRLTMNILKHALRAFDLKVSDTSLKAIAGGYYGSLGGSDHDGKVLQGYLDCLKNIPLDDHIYDSNLLGIHYGKLQGESELTSYYRTVDNVKQVANLYAGFAHVYKEAPAASIESLMESMFSFQEVDTTKELYKAIAVAFFILYIKPFDHNNLALATLGLKSVLGGKGIGYVPFEAAFISDPRLEEISKESQLSGDLTYYLIRVMDMMTPLLKAMNDAISEEKRNGLDKEHYQEDTPARPIPKTHEPTPAPTIAPTPAPVPAPQPEPEPEIQEEPPQVEPVQDIYHERFEADDDPYAVHEEPEPVNYQKPVQPAPVPPKPTPKPAPTPKPVTKQTPTIERVPTSPISGELALTGNMEEPNEKQVREMAKFLLETHPMLRKGQALFFASHCTLGRYYSIQDYKKYNRCVYETARTSMDALAAEGLYKKVQIKNKYLYTPIRQGDE